jgi:hypothetical protein
MLGGQIMEFLRQTVSSADLSGILSLPPSLFNRRVQVIVLPDEAPAMEQPNYKCNIGIAKGAEVPDSFFEPLPEEDLQAWGV